MLVKELQREFPDAPAVFGRVVTDTVAETMSHLVQTSAAYHDYEHTMMVTLAGLAILAGKRRHASLTAEDWLHAVCAMLMHDIGFSRTACTGDTETRVLVGDGDRRVDLDPAASDACLAPYHVDRGMVFARTFFARTVFDGTSVVDGERVARAVGCTRFPVPGTVSFHGLDQEGALVRSADLIGQLADPLYPQKLHKLFAEMQETGAADAAGYLSAKDMLDDFPLFFEAQVAPWIAPALSFLAVTSAGRDWAARLSAQVARAQAGRSRGAPDRA